MHVLQFDTRHYLRKWIISSWPHLRNEMINYYLHLLQKKCKYVWPKAGPIKSPTLFRCTLKNIDEKRDQWVKNCKCEFVTPSHHFQPTHLAHISHLRSGIFQLRLILTRHDQKHNFIFLHMKIECSNKSPHFFSRKKCCTYTRWKTSIKLLASYRTYTLPAKRR